MSRVSRPTTIPGPPSRASPVVHETVKVVPGGSPAGRKGVFLQVYVVFSVTP